MWTYQNNELHAIPDNAYGFVYCITNRQTGRRYVGKKLFYSAKRKQVKGRKKRFKVESDWQDYWGSNKVLLADIQELGTEHFQRDILQICATKGECSYWESKYQFEWDVLRFPEQFYNEWIMCKIHRNHLEKTL